jgi:transcriptional regulator with XRE-family HTH domain
MASHCRENPIRLNAKTLDHYKATYRLQTTASYEFYNRSLMDPRTAFGKQVRARREALGYSQEGLAEMAHLHRTYIGSVERGERNVSLLNIWRVAEALSVSPATFFSGTEKLDHSGSQRIERSTPGTSRRKSRDSKWTKKQRA